MSTAARVKKMNSPCLCSLSRHSSFFATKTQKLCRLAMDSEALARTCSQRTVSAVSWMVSL